LLTTVAEELIDSTQFDGVLPMLQMPSYPGTARGIPLQGLALEASYMTTDHTTNLR
jgi:hypothetical protein